jgi:hypothetical protein
VGEQLSASTFNRQTRAARALRHVVATGLRDRYVLMRLPQTRVRGPLPVARWRQQRRFWHAFRGRRASSRPRSSTQGMRVLTTQNVATCVRGFRRRFTTVPLVPEIQNGPGAR